VRLPKPLTGSVLSRLAAEALATCLGQAEAFEVAMHPGCCLVLSGEPVADVNYLVAGRAPRRVITLPQPAYAASRAASRSCHRLSGGR